MTDWGSLAFEEHYAYISQRDPDWFLDLIPKYDLHINEVS